MPAAREVAVDALLAHNLLHAINRGQRRRVQALRPLPPVPGNQPVDSQFQAAEHHAAVARTGSPADGLGLNHHDRRTLAGQRSRRGQTREPSPNHRHIGRLRPRGRGLGLRHLRRAQPVVVFPHSLRWFPLGVVAGGKPLCRPGGQSPIKSSQGSPGRGLEPRTFTARPSPESAGPRRSARDSAAMRQSNQSCRSESGPPGSCPWRAHASRRGR